MRSARDGRFDLPRVFLVVLGFMTKGILSGMCSRTARGACGRPRLR